VKVINCLIHPITYCKILPSLLSLAALLLSVIGYMVLQVAVLVRVEFGVCLIRGYISVWKYVDINEQ
jgi:hypothetical protein